MLWRFCIVGVALVVMIVAAAKADTLVTRDGRRLTGAITRIDGGYIVVTKMGARVVIEDSNCAEFIKEGATPAVPATAPSAVRATLPVAADVPSSNPASRPTDARNISALLQQGINAMAAGEYAAAREAFADAAMLDCHNLTALHGQGLASLYLNDFAHARDPMDMALTIPTGQNRALAINAALVQIGLRNQMRAAKIIREYLASHPTELDEPMLNAMAVALNLADDQAKKQKFFAECEAFYVAANARVEAQVPGQKRWGIQWMAADVVDQKMQEYRAAVKRATILAQEVEEMSARVEACQNEADRAAAALAHRGGNFEVLRSQEKLQSAKADRDRKEESLQQAKAAIHPPDFPHSVTPLALDDLTPPPVTGVSAVVLAVASKIPDPAGADDAPRVRPHPRPDPDPATPPKTPAAVANAPETPVEAPIQIVARPVAKKKVQITSYAAAFPVAADLVVTSAATLEGSGDIELQGVDGTLAKGSVVRSDAALGLALVRLTGRIMRPLPLGAEFSSGNVHIAGFPTPDIFTPNSEMMLGSVSGAGDSGKLRVARNPRLAGAPMLAGGKVIGVELATRDADLSQVPYVSLEQLLKFLGTDAAKGTVAAVDPLTAVMQLTATRDSRQ